MSTPVYVGRWTDWTYGSVLGARITMSSDNANVLIAFLAIFASVVGGFAWSLAAYLVHRRRAGPVPRDGLYHQLQVLLRNSDSTTAFASQAISAGWRWRRLAPKSLWRVISISFLPLVLGLAFTAAGIASSQIASTGHVLLRGGDCGVIVANSSLTGNQSFAFEVGQILHIAQAMSVSQNYADVCYDNTLNHQSSVVSGQLRSKDNCAYFVKPTLNYTASFGTPSCPFGKLCNVPLSDVLTVQTDLLDSHTHLGQNQPPQNRVQFRRKQVCAPIKDKVSFHVINDLERLGNVSEWSYGTNNIETNTFVKTKIFPKFPGVTFIYSQSSDTAADTPYYLDAASTLDYTLGNDTQTYYQSYIPSSDIATNKTIPLSLFFLANRAIYWNETTDAWFNATFPLLQQTVNANVTMYLNNNVGSVLACLEEGQICNPNNAKCTDSNSWYTWIGIPDAFKDIELNDVQIATAAGIHNTWFTGNAFSVVSQLGDTSLIANQYIAAYRQGISPGLATNQWQIEAANWFGISLAAIQSNYVSRSRKPVSNDALLPFWQPLDSDDKAGRNLCGSQKVRSSGYQSFSVFGLVLDLVLGCVIIITSVLITSVIPDMRKSKHDSLKRKQWTADGALQLQRVAYERLGLGEWEGDETETPVTKRGQLFKAHVLGAGKLPATHHALQPLVSRPDSPDFHIPENASTRRLNPYSTLNANDSTDDLSYRRV